MNTITVKNNNQPILPNLNFLHREFYSPKYPQPPMLTEFELPVCLPKALQAFRDYYSKKYGKPIAWNVTCTLRRGKTDFEKHKDCVDSVPAINTYEIMQDIKNEFKNWKTSELVKNVLATGTNVLIIENGCLHIGYRTYSLRYHPEYSKDGFYIGEWKPGGQFGINTAYC